VQNVAQNDAQNDAVYAVSIRKVDNGWTKDYKGRTIRIDGGGTFWSGDIYGARSFASCREIEAAIEASIRDEETEARKRCGIKAVTEDGETVVVTGVHAKSGELLTKPQPRQTKFGGAPMLYLDHPTVRALIECVKALRDAEKRLGVYEITWRTDDDRYGNIKSVGHTAAVDRMERRANEAVRALDKAKGRESVEEA
jgi:hypothetical protein